MRACVLVCACVYICVCVHVAGWEVTRRAGGDHAQHAGDGLLAGGLPHVLHVGHAHALSLAP
jgi:hypothetical protein